MSVKYPHTTLLLKIFFLLAMLSTVQMQSNTEPTLLKVLPCLQFKNRECIRCPQITHLYEQQCYQNMTNCIQYQYGTASSYCKKFASLTNVQQDSVTSTLTIKNSSYFYSTTVTSNNTSSNSQDIFIQYPISTAMNDSLFLQCHNFMRKGQYSHFISRSQQPIQSIFSTQSKGFMEFKILYEGSGGNLLMCLIGINISTKNIILRSFVTIGRTQVIESCIDYTTSMACQKCEEGYHLDYSSNGEKICVKNIPGCIEYWRDVCVKCRGFMYLVEGKCLADCSILKDGRAIRFYGDIDYKKQFIVQMIDRSWI